MKEAERTSQGTPRLGEELFSVTLPWDMESPSAGDYATSCWAADDTEAVALVATEMAPEHSTDPEEQAEFVAELVERHKRLPFPVYPLVPGLISDLNELLQGELPAGTSITYERLRSLVLNNLSHFAEPAPAALGPAPG